MNQALQSLFWLLVTIAIVVPIHEFGHYRVAVACGVKVLRFSVGFGRVVWSRRLGRDGTEFAISAIPLGGYVKMVDRRDPMQAISPADMAREFTGRPLRQRVAIVAAGPLANLLTAALLFAFVQWHGIEEASPVLGGPRAGGLMAQAGLRAGDRVVASAIVDSEADDDWQDVRSLADLGEAAARAMLDRRPLRLRVSHPGEAGLRTVTVATQTLDPDQGPAGLGPGLGLGPPQSTTRLDEVASGGPAAAAGLRRGDEVLAIDGRPVADGGAVRESILASVAADGAPRTMRWQVRRDGVSLDLSVQPRLEGEGAARAPRVGVGFHQERVLVRLGALDALRQGVVQTWRTSVDSLRMFGRMLTGQASLKNLSGPGAIGEAASSSAQAGPMTFLGFLALISVSLGVLNLLPVPLLDGGMLLYYLFEGATGRPVPELWQSRLQYGGLIAILLLMSIALSNDLAHYMGRQ